MNKLELIEMLKTEAGLPKNEAAAVVHLFFDEMSTHDSATQKREVHALQSAMKELGLSKGTIVTWLDEDVSDQRIDIVPVWKWLLTE